MEFSLWATCCRVRTLTARGMYLMRIQNTGPTTIPEKPQDKTTCRHEIQNDHHEVLRVDAKRHHPRGPRREIVRADRNALPNAGLTRRSEPQEERKRVRGRVLERGTSAAHPNLYGVTAKTPTRALARALTRALRMATATTGRGSLLDGIL